MRNDGPRTESAGKPGQATLWLLLAMVIWALTPDPATAQTGPDAAVGEASQQGDSSWGNEEAEDTAGFGAPQGAADAAGFGAPQGAEEGWGDSADAVGFGSEATESVKIDSNSGELSATGSLRERTGFWTRRLADTPLAQLRFSLDGQLRYKKRLSWFDQPVLLRIVASGHGERDLAYLVDRDAYDAATLDAYEGQLIGGETFLSLSQGPLELTLGRQIVNLGRGDLLSPLDIVNPRDQREPGLAELQDMRLAVLASRLGLFEGFHRVELMVVHEAYFGLRPAPLSFYSPLRASLDDIPLTTLKFRYQDAPVRYSVDGQQFYARYGYAGPGFDLGVYAASTLDQQVIVDFVGLARRAQSALNPFSQSPSELVVPLLHPRYEMVGASAAIPVGSFVVRAELGLDIQRSFMNTGLSYGALSPGAPLPSVFRGEQLNWMLGAVYSGITDGTVTLEYAGRHLFAAPQGFGRPSIPDLAVLYRQDLFQQRVHVLLSALVFGLFDNEFQGGLGRLELSYDLAEALSASLGYIAYLPNRRTRQLAALTGYENNDRLYVTLRWDFMLD